MDSYKLTNTVTCSADKKKIFINYVRVVNGEVISKREFDVPNIPLKGFCPVGSRGLHNIELYEYFKDLFMKQPSKWLNITIDECDKFAKEAALLASGLKN